MKDINLKDVVFETFQDYKKTATLLATCFCDWKCLTERGLDITICQNCTATRRKTITYDIDTLIEKYLMNPLSKAIVFGGLEPMKQIDEILSFIDRLRGEYFCEDDIVIYTGYYPEEIPEILDLLREYSNIIVKFGRFDPESEPHFDEVLGIELASSNQWGEKIS